MYYFPTRACLGHMPCTNYVGCFDMLTCATTGIRCVRWPSHRALHTHALTALHLDTGRTGCRHGLHTIGERVSDAPQRTHLLHNGHPLWRQGCQDGLDSVGEGHLSLQPRRPVGRQRGQELGPAVEAQPVRPSGSHLGQGRAQGGAGSEALGCPGRLGPTSRPAGHPAQKNRGGH